MPPDLFASFARNGYWVVFLGVLLENAGVPVPGETVLLAAGFFAAQGHFRLPLVMAVAACAAVLGDNVGYLAGRLMGRAALERYGRVLRLSPARLSRFDGFFSRHGAETILIARFVTGLRVVAALLAGAARMRWGSFVLYNCAGAVLWSIAISLLGYFFGHSWVMLERWVGRVGLAAVSIAALAAVITLWLRRRHLRRKTARSERADVGVPRSPGGEEPEAGRPDPADP
jgi:membrane protein DedA with SNARE-associated domain